MSASILAVGSDPVLLRTRALVLESDGYSVSLAATDREAVALMEEPNDFALVLLCHSLPESSRMALANTIRKARPSLPIMILRDGNNPTKATFDASVHRFASPGALLGAIRFLTATFEDSPVTAGQHYTR